MKTKQSASQPVVTRETLILLNPDGGAAGSEGPSVEQGPKLGGKDCFIFNLFDELFLHGFDANKKESISGIPSDPIP